MKGLTNNVLAAALAFLLLLSACIAAPATTQTGIIARNYSSSNTHTLLKWPQSHCLNWLIDGDNYIKLCNCYESGSSLDRLLIMTGVQTACNDFFTKKTYDSDTTYSYNYWYKTKDSTTANKYVRFTMLNVATELPRCRSETMDFGTCYGHLRYVTDSCDTDGENGKHGGWARNICLMFGVDTDPGVNSDPIVNEVACAA